MRPSCTEPSSLGEKIASLTATFEKFAGKTDQSFGAIDKRFGEVDKRFGEVGKRLDQMDQRGFIAVVRGDR